MLSLRDTKPKLFDKYACNDKSKRRKIGGSVGRPALVTDETSDFMAAVIIRADRANEGKHLRRYAMI